jgi:hypothetical protein
MRTFGALLTVQTGSAAAISPVEYPNKIMM